MTDPTGVTRFSYDPASRLTAVAAPQGTVSYAYDAAGRRTGLTLPGPRTVSYAYDAASQLTGLTDWLGQATSFSYDSDGRRTSIARPAGIKTTYGYDAAGRLTTVNHDTATTALAHFAYTLDANGNRTSLTSAAGTESYALDALNRITNATYPNGDVVSYTYDRAGNRLSSTRNGLATNFTYDLAGRLVSAGGVTFSYDAAGNITAAGSDTFAWDWNERLTSATVGGTTSTYNYDGDSVRVRAQVGATPTNYLWDRVGDLALLVDDGTRGYVQGGGVLEQLDVGGTATAIYPLADALGSVRGLANNTAAVAGTTAYDVFGAVRTQTGSSTIFGFTGEQTDATGFTYLRARYLISAIGRFLSPDSVFPNASGTPGFNLYAYVANNPTSLSDPTGQVAFSEFALRVQTVLIAALEFALANRLRACLVGAVAGVIGNLGVGALADQIPGGASC